MSCLPSTCPVSRVCPPAQSLQEPVVESLLLRLRAVLHDDVQPGRGGIEQRVQRCYAIKSGINGMLDVARRLYSEAYDEFACELDLGGEGRGGIRAYSLPTVMCMW